MKKKILFAVILMLANSVKAQDTIPFLDNCFGYTPLYAYNFNTGGMNYWSLPYTDDVFYNTHFLGEYYLFSPEGGGLTLDQFVGGKQSVLGIAVCHNPGAMNFDSMRLSIYTIDFPQETAPNPLVTVFKSLSGPGDVYYKQMVYSFGDSLLHNPYAPADTLGNTAPCFVYLFDSAVQVPDPFYLGHQHAQFYHKNFFILTQPAMSPVVVCHYGYKTSYFDSIELLSGAWQWLFPVYSLPCPAPSKPTIEVGDDGARAVRWRQGYDTVLYQLAFFRDNGALLFETDTLTDTVFTITDSLWPTIGFEQSGYVRVKVRKACDYLDSPYHTLVWSDYSEPLRFFHQHTAGVDGVGMPASAYFTVAPNPATQRVVLERPEELGDESAVLTVCDLAGREVMECRVNGTHHELDVSQWPRGVYLLRLTTPTASSLRRLVVE